MSVSRLAVCPFRTNFSPVDEGTSNGVGCSTCQRPLASRISVMGSWFGCIPIKGKQKSCSHLQACATHLGFYSPVTNSRFDPPFPPHPQQSTALHQNRSLSPPSHRTRFEKSGSGWLAVRFAPSANPFELFTLRRARSGCLLCRFRQMGVKYKMLG